MVQTNKNFDGMKTKLLKQVKYSKFFYCYHPTGTNH